MKRTSIITLLAFALTLGCSGAAQAAFPGANGKLAFDKATQDDYRDIMSMDATPGAAETNLTNTNGVDDQEPAWSPDGTKIAFDSGGHIVLMNADGSSPQQITSGPTTDQQPTWSPDGTKIAFARFGSAGGDIFVVNADGSGTPTQITDYSAQGGSAQAPAWSPDGSTIAYQAILPPSGVNQIFTINADGSGTPTAITDGSTDDEAPDWAPNGQQIAYQGVASVNGTSYDQLFVASSDGSGASQVMVDPTNDVHPAWSPDGTELAFSRADPTTGVSTIWTVPAAGGAPTQLTTDGVSEGNPDWQPVPQPPPPPAVASIDSGPSGVTGASSAAFTFHASTSGATFVCQLQQAGGPAQNWTPCSSPDNFSGLADGSYTFAVAAADSSGAPQGTPATSTFLVDTTPPVTTDDAPSGWQNSDVTVHLTATDPGADATPATGSGVATTEYQLDGGSWTEGTSVLVPAPADHSNDGVHTITYRSIDNAGNVEATHSTRVSIDTTPPVTTDDAPTGWQSSDVTVHLTASDAGSGVASTQYQVDGGAWTTGTSVLVPAPADHSNDGVHTISYRSIDNAGNVEAIHSATVSIDTTPPVTTDDAPSGWENSAVTVHLSATDAGSGVASTQYQVDGGAWTTGTSVVVPAPSDHSNDGVHTISYRSIDNAGNVEATHAATVRIDTTAPVTTSDAPSGSQSGSVTVHLTATDPGANANPPTGSGVAMTQYKVDGAANWTTGTCVAVHSGSDHWGWHVIAFRSVDNAGNVEATKYALVRVRSRDGGGGD